MIRTALATIALIAGAIPVTAAGDVAPEIHQLCLQAADYRGCVEAQAGTPEYLGNKCPENHAYVGEGKCQRVYCDWVGLGGGHHEPLVAGKSTWRCGNNYNFWKDELQVGILRLGATVEVEQTSTCPSVAPQEGWNSSCEHAEDNWRAIDAEAKRPKCSKRLVAFECDWSGYLEANPGMKAWAESRCRYQGLVLLSANRRQASLLNPIKHPLQWSWIAADLKLSHHLCKDLQGNRSHKFQCRRKHL